jgi:hypothetical protein
MDANGIRSQLHRRPALAALALCLVLFASFATAGHLHVSGADSGACYSCHLGTDHAAVAAALTVPDRAPQLGQPGTERPPAVLLRHLRPYASRAPPTVS